MPIPAYVEPAQRNQRKDNPLFSSAEVAEVEDGWAAATASLPEPEAAELSIADEPVSECLGGIPVEKLRVQEKAETGNTATDVSEMKPPAGMGKMEQAKWKRQQRVKGPGLSKQ